jgi:hypothetical protein
MAGRFGERGGDDELCPHELLCPTARGNRSPLSSFWFSADHSIGSAY